MKKRYFQLLTLSGIIFLLSACGGNVCDDLNCGLNGTCNEETESCDCDEYYEGDLCGQEIREFFIGDWKAVSICTGAGGTFDIEISKGVEVNEVKIQTAALLQNFTMSGVLDSNNNIDIPNFNISVSAFNIYFGSIVRQNDGSLLFTLSADVNGDISSCDYELTK